MQNKGYRRVILIVVVLFIVTFALGIDQLYTIRRRSAVSAIFRERMTLTRSGQNGLKKTKEVCQKRVPESIIIGVNKAGTQAFCDFLTIHPQVAMARTMSETMFFTRNYNKGKAWYINKMMCGTSDQISMEKAEHYFKSKSAAPRIHQMNPNMRMILIVRNPVDRAISQHLQAQHLQDVGESVIDLEYNTFEDCAFNQSGNVNANCRYIEGSKYSTLFKTWLQYFPRNQFLIIDGDKFKTVPFESMDQTEHFLGISTFVTEDKLFYNEVKGFYCLSETGCMGSGKGREHPVLDPVHLKNLQEHFKPYNEEFYELVGTRFNW